MLDSVVLAVKCTLYLNFVVTQSKKNFCECGKVYIGEAGRCMHKRIKEHDRDIRLSQTQTQTPAVSIKPGIIRSGTMLNLLNETLTGTLEEPKRLFP